MHDDAHHIPARGDTLILCMLLFALILFPFLLLGWLLLTPLIIEADTRVPELRMEWKRLVTLRITYEEERGWLSIDTYFFKRRQRLGAGAAGKKDAALHKKRSVKQLLFRSLRVLKTFRIIRAEIALDTSDPVQNAQLYPLNFYSYPAGRAVRINFLGENYLFLRIQNTPWRMLRAWVGV